jgi:hypothetical protein
MSFNSSTLLLMRPTSGEGIVIATRFEQRTMGDYL